MPFLSQVAIRRIGLNRWQLLEALCFRSLVDGRTYTAPAGFVTDFATRPWWLAWLMSRTGIWDEPAVLHDLCCVDVRRYYNEVRAGVPNPRRPWRDARQTDQLWREMLLEAGLDRVRARVLWAAVRWGALATPARRAGWWRDAPAVLATTVLALAPAALLLGLAVRGLLG